MVETVEDLNYDFGHNLWIATTLLSNLTNPGDREKASSWFRKLGTCNRTVNEMRLRNDFMYYLVVNIQHGELQPPFNEHAPPNPLPNIAHLLSEGVGAEDEETFWEDDKLKKNGKKPMVYEKSPDGGAFLAAQPVPRCGAFCYLAVVTRNPKSEED